MKNAALAAATLVLAALTGSAAAQAAPPSVPASAQVPAGEKRFEGVYSISANMGNVGEFRLSFTQRGAAYETAATRRVTGFARALVNDDQDYAYSSRGAVTAAGLRPQSYRHQGGRRNRVVEAQFSASDIVTTSNPPGMGMGDPPATTAQKRGAVDQLTAIATMLTARADPCAGTIPVYLDGRARFDFVMSANGRVNVDTRAYRGQAIRCRVQFRPIAGFGDPQEASELTFLFAPTSSGMFAPIRIQMPTDDAGVVTLEARSLTVNGTALR